MYLFFQDSILSIDYSMNNGGAKIISVYSLSEIWNQYTLYDNDMLLKGFVDRSETLYLVYGRRGYFKICTSIAYQDSQYSINYSNPIYYPNYMHLNHYLISSNDYHIVTLFSESTGISFNHSVVNYYRVFSFDSNANQFPIYDIEATSSCVVSVDFLSGYFG